MDNSGFYQIPFRGSWKLPKVRANANVAINKTFYWAV